MPDATPFRSFDDGVFVESDAWRRLEAILATNGGAYALSGPRGAGKSWLMQKALAEAKAEDSLTLWYPSPSNYSPFEFLSTLSDNFANQIERQYRPDRFYPTFASSPWRMAAGALCVIVGVAVAVNLPAGSELARTSGLVILTVVLLATLFAFWSSMSTPDGDTASSSWVRRVSASVGWFVFSAWHPRSGPRPLRGTDMYRRIALVYAWIAVVFLGGFLVFLGVSSAEVVPYDAVRQLTLAGAATLAGFAILIATLRSVALERQPDRLLTREAGLLRERIRFSSKTKEGSEFGAKGGLKGLAASAKTSREKELVERPTTVASLIHDFRALAERAGEVSGKVVIAIDELDKIADAEAVRALLRDVKGIFEIPRVFFLVSISDEATRLLKLGGVAARDEFNSSFYTIVDVPPMDAAFVTLLFGKRKTDIDPDVAEGLALLTCGNPRETLRLADVCLRSGHKADLRSAVAAAMLEEVRAFRAEAMAATAPGLPRGLDDQERMELAERLADARFAPETFAATSLRLWDEWSPDWAGEFWRAELQPRWSRLLVRLQVAAALVASKRASAELEAVLGALDESPVVARQLIAGKAQTDAKPLRKVAKETPKRSRAAKPQERRKRGAPAGSD